MTYTKISPEFQSAFWQSLQDVLEEQVDLHPYVDDMEADAAVLAGTQLLQQIEHTGEYNHSALMNDVWAKIECN